MTAALASGCAAGEGAADRLGFAEAGAADRLGFASAGAQPQVASAPPRPALDGVALPRVPVLTFANETTRLDAMVTGKVALVSLWATWCESCAAEFDALNRLDERVRPSGGMVVGVAVGESRARVVDFARQRQLRYPQLVDEEFKLADALGQRRLPSTLVVDRAGRVVFSGGALDERALAAFRAALEGG